MKASIGNQVHVDFECIMDNGTVIDSSSQHEPLKFEIGMGEFMGRIEKRLLGLSVGQEEEVLLNDAYGRFDPNLVLEVPFSKMPHASVGDMTFITHDEVNYPAKVASIKKDKVVLDLNHPLAGRTLKFKIRLNEIT